MKSPKMLVESHTRMLEQQIFFKPTRGPNWDRAQLTSLDLLIIHIQYCAYRQRLSIIMDNKQIPIKKRSDYTRLIQEKSNGTIG